MAAAVRTATNLWAEIGQVRHCVGSIEEDKNASVVSLWSEVGYDLDSDKIGDSKIFRDIFRLKSLFMLEPAVTAV